ncbi:FMN-binding negative transcriptional regulator [Flexivirga caeni]|uniref:FMN-binding negative transcriptional regulator n=1 Tax=Flexivirga caeni TaxID=2294115 RepID=A0A3M9MEG8_9MICO|nr:FMN-binding negative transcriptional regulator [Flexivirga caeni]RNI23949.1 FMN-binding negative transcriptional regulator [Flexivirga caeni]
MVYLPAHDAAPGAAEVADLIDAVPLATLVTSDGNALSANHIPLLLELGEGGDRLVGHVARANEVWREGNHEGETLVVFSGAEHYVSPTWYPSKQEHHQVVPTWNYLVAHVYGELVIHDDVRWTRAVVAKLTQRMERGRPDAWHMGQAPADYLAGQLDKIVGVELRISRIVGKFKVSAGRSAADRGGAADGIEADAGRSPLVDAMRAVEQRG